MESLMTHWLELLKGSVSSDLPDEIVYDILQRLPVKSIIRFKSVCKPWYTLLSDPKFIKAHLYRAIMNNSGYFILKHLSSSEEETNFYGILERSGMEIYPTQISEDIRKEIYSLQSSGTFNEFGEVKVPVKTKSDYFQIVESSQGLICLTESDAFGSCLLLNTFLWNPSIHEFRILPDGYFKKYGSPLRVVGLGFAFHSKISDYRVVRIVYSGKGETLDVDVYSLSTDSWRRVETNIRCSFIINLSQAFVNGALHWMASQMDGNGAYHDFILSFDIGSDKFDKIMLPEFHHVDYFKHKFLTMFRESLALFVYDCRLNVNREANCDVWIMKEHGVVESWAKLLTIQLKREVMRPLQFIDDVELIMERNNGELVLCDLEVGKVKHLHVFGPVRIVKYMETLVSPMGRKVE